MARADPNSGPTHGDQAAPNAIPKTNGRNNLSFGDNFGNEVINLFSRPNICLKAPNRARPISIIMIQPKTFITS